MDYKQKVEELLDITLDCEFEDYVFKDIFETLMWDNYYDCYNKTNGFFPNSIKLDRKNLYLPYYLYYLDKRYVQIYFIMCDKNNTNGLITTRIYEGQFGNIFTTTGYVNEDLIDLNELCQNYLYGKELKNLPEEHWKHKFYQKDNCIKAYNLVNYYTELLNINEKHFEDMNTLCLILANIHLLYRYPPKENNYYCCDIIEYIEDDEEEYKSISYYVNLESDKILCKKYECDKENIMVDFDEIGIDYPHKENIFTPNIKLITI